MKERVKQLNGELRVSKAEPGTMVEATIPLFDKVLTTLGSKRTSWFLARHASFEQANQEIDAALVSAVLYLHRHSC